MDKKYYTPKLSEVHIGFEYEYRSSDGKHWTPCVIEERDFQAVCWDLGANNAFDDIVEALSTGGVRVKFLNREEIESLGWIISKQYDGEYFAAQKIISEDALCVLHYDQFDKDLLIELYQKRPNGNYDLDTLFWGIIQNKSELKLLLKFLRI